MSKMKNLFIDMMNEDWERMPLHEKSFIMAEKDHYERQIMQELWEEEQKAKIIQDDSEKLQKGVGEQPETGRISDVGVSSGEGEHQAPARILGISADTFSASQAGTSGSNGRGSVHGDDQGRADIQSNK